MVIGYHLKKWKFSPNNIFVLNGEGLWNLFKLMHTFIEIIRVYIKNYTSKTKFTSFDFRHFVYFSIHNSNTSKTTIQKTWPHSKGTLIFQGFVLHSHYNKRNEFLFFSPEFDLEIIMINPNFYGSPLTHVNNSLWE